MNYKRLAALGCVGILTLGLIGCGTDSATNGDASSDSVNYTANASADSSSSAETLTATGTSAVITCSADLEKAFTARDYEIGYDESTSIKIVFTDTGASLVNASSQEASEAVIIDGTTVTITQEGTYILTGSAADGQVIVDTDDAKVQLVLDGVDITNDDSAAIYVKNADKVFLTLADGSENYLTTSGEFAETAEDEDNIDGVIFSKDDLTMNGNGSLTITSAAGHGVVSKDDLKITSGTYTISAAKKGLSGKDSVRIADGTINIIKSKEGIEGKFILINDGNISIVSSDDGLNASDGSGSEMMGGFGGPGQGGFDPTNQSESGTMEKFDPTNQSSSDKMGSAESSGQDSSASQEIWIEINGGYIYINASGDGIDSNGNLTINGGEIYVDGPSDGGNGALDCGDFSTATINGGIVVAVGNSSMAENFGENSSQGSMLVVLDQTVNGEEVSLLDASGKELLSFKASKSYNSVVISCAELAAGETYTVKTASTSTTVEMTDLIYANQETGFGAMKGGMGGGPMGGGPMGGNMEKPMGGPMGDQTADTSSEESY